MMIHSIGDISSCGCHFMASQKEGTVGGKKVLPTQMSFCRCSMLFLHQYIIRRIQMVYVFQLYYVCALVFWLAFGTIFSLKKGRILSFQHGIEIPWSVTKEYFVLHCQQFLIGRGGIVQKEMHRKGGLPDVQKYVFSANVDFVYFANRFCVKVCRIV